MPVLKIQTNISIHDKQGLLQTASKHIASVLGKPESYVMIILSDESDMLFAGTDSPLAFLELKSLGLPENQTRALSESLCSLIEKELGIDSARIYIEFASPERHMFGWNKATF